MLEAGLRDRIRKRVGLNPNSLCRSQRRYTMIYGASIIFSSLKRQTSLLLLSTETAFDAC